MFSESIVTIVETIQFFPKDKTCLGFSRVRVVLRLVWPFDGILEYKMTNSIFKTF